MPNAHYFIVDDLAAFITNLEQRDYQREVVEEDNQESLVYSKTMSEAVVKY